MASCTSLKSFLSSKDNSERTTSSSTVPSSVRDLSADSADAACFGFRIAFLIASHQSTSPSQIISSKLSMRSMVGIFMRTLAEVHRTPRCSPRLAKSVFVGKLCLLISPKKWRSKLSDSWKRIKTNSPPNATWSKVQTFQSEGSIMWAQCTTPEGSNAHHSSVPSKHGAIGHSRKPQSNWPKQSPHKLGRFCWESSKERKVSSVANFEKRPCCTRTPHDLWVCIVCKTSEKQRPQLHEEAPPPKGTPNSCAPWLWTIAPAIDGPKQNNASSFCDQVSAWTSAQNSFCQQLRDGECFFRTKPLTASPILEFDAQSVACSCGCSFGYGHVHAGLQLFCCPVKFVACPLTRVCLLGSLHQSCHFQRACTWVSQAVTALRSVKICKETEPLAAACSSCKIESKSSCITSIVSFPEEGCGYEKDGSTSRPAST